MNIITGLTLDFTKHRKLQYGEYMQTHKETDNATSHLRMVGAVALWPTGNVEKGYLFYSLKTGRVVIRNR